MRLSIHSGTVLRGTVTDVVAEAARTAEAGLAGYWAPMLDGLDTLTVLAVAAREVPGIEFGTAVVPIPLRSPYALAQQARTVQDVSGGRLALGLGTGHAEMVRDVFGGEWRPPLGAMTAYLEGLSSVLRTSAGPRPPLLVGAVNPGMAGVAAALADGVITWAAGPRTIAEVVAPAAAQRSAGPFRIVVALPLSVTDDVEGARQAVHRGYGANDRLSSYQKVLRRERVDGVADLALVGDERSVRDQLARFADLGVTEFAAHVVAKRTDLERTWDFLAKEATR